MKPENKAIKMDNQPKEVEGNGVPDDRPTMTDESQVAEQPESVEP